MSTTGEQTSHYCNKYAVFCTGANGHGECNTTACWNNQTGVSKVRLIDADALPIDIDYHDVEDAPTISDWIPCSEQEPEEDGYYLVCWSDGQIETEWYDNEGWGYFDVVAWMPLPEPYSIESDGIERRSDE